MRPRRNRGVPAGAALLGVALLLLAGCGLGNGGRVPVRGKVTLYGEPVDGGVIVFLPATGAKVGGSPTGGPIENGSYSLAGRQGPLPGHYRVEIRWPKKTGRQIPVPGDAPNMTDE